MQRKIWLPFSTYWNRQRGNIKGNCKFGCIKGMWRYWCSHKNSQRNAVFLQIFYTQALMNLWKKSEFLSALKQGNKTPVFKKGEREFKKYRPVSILSNISKIFERIIFR